MPYCFNHGPEFHRWANYFEYHLGILVTTKTDEEESLGMKRSLVPRARAINVCLDCGGYRLYHQMTKPIQRWRKYGRPTRSHCCPDGQKSKDNYLTIQYNGKSLTDASLCHPDIKAKAEEWLKKHVPPKGILNEPFIWTAERIETEYWWKEEIEPKTSVAKAASREGLSEIILPNAPIVDSALVSYEQISLF
jgi:hypothetical protein